MVEGGGDRDDDAQESLGHDKEIWAGVLNSMDPLEMEGISHCEDMLSGMGIEGSGGGGGGGAARGGGRCEGRAGGGGGISSSSSGTKLDGSSTMTYSD